MLVKRKFEDLEIQFRLTDEELIELITEKSLDERTVFFRKLFQTDIKNMFTLKYITNLLK
jgi:hypothetical protein